MEIENIFDLGRIIGICKIWIISPVPVDSPFYQPMPTPLNLLKNKLEKLEIQEGTIKEIENFLEMSKNVLDIVKQISKIEEGESKKKSEKLNKEVERLTKEIQENLAKRIPIWEDRIVNELAKIKVVKLSTDTILNPEKLSFGAESFFDEKIWKKMSDLEKDDLDDGCRCISLQAWTPAAMITMRVIESVLRNYYTKITSNDPTGKMWGSILTELENQQSTNQKLIGYFNYLKDIRNKLQHPDVRFSQFEAEDAFHHAIHILNTFYS